MSRFQTIRALFLELRDAPPSLRASRLSTLEDSTLAAEVADLLRASEAPSPIDAPLRDAPLVEAQPTQIGRYRVLREIGRGAMGVVFEAEQSDPRRRVALKTIHPGARTSSAHELFRREVQAMADAVHPGIPHVYEVLEYGGDPVVAMELVDGQRLDRAVEALSVRERAALLHAVAIAVGHAHARGVIHRDLKPSNVLVTADRQPKVIDFGVAALAGVDGPAGSGTLAYMAPEQRAGARVGPQADVFALGVIGRELVPSADAELRAIFACATAVDPARRYADASILAADLARYLAGRAPVAAAGLLPTVRAWTRRHRRALGLSAVGLAAMFGFSAWDAWQDAQNAAAHEATAKADLEALLARPVVSDADLQAFVDRPDVEGTSAVSTAWAWQAARRDGDDARRARVRAVVFAVDEAQDRAALLALATQLAAEDRWSELRNVLEALPPDEAPELRVAAALAGWDLDAGAALLGPERAGLLRPLRSAREVGPYDAAGWSAAGPVGMRDHQADVLDAQDHVVRTYTFPERACRMTSAGGEAWVFTGEPRGLVYRLGEQAEPIAVPDESAVATMLAADADADGEAELYLARCHPQRDLLVASPASSAPRSLHPATDASFQEMDVAVADLDGDGLAEVITSGASGASGDVRVLTGAPDHATLASRFRLRGRPVAVQPTPAGPLIVVGADQPAWRSELVRLRWDGAQLALVDHVRLSAAGSAVHVADLDGDGLQDLLVSGYVDRHRRVLTLLRQQADGSLAAPVRLAGLTVLNARTTAAGPELWLTDGERTWLVGPGGAALPSRELPPAPPIVLVGLDDHPATRPAARLAALGLKVEAGEALLAIGGRPGRTDERALAAALSLLGDADSDVAQDVALKLAAAPVRDEAVRLAAAEVLGRRLNFDALARLAQGGSVGRWDAPLRALAAKRATLTFDHPLHPAWQISSPGAVRRLPTEGALELAYTMDRGELASLPLDWDGGPLQISATLDVAEIDWAAGFEVGVQVGEWRQGTLMWRIGSGGPAHHREIVQCYQNWPVNLPEGEHQGRRTLVFTLADGEVSCGLPDQRVRARAVPERPAGPARLVLRASMIRDGDHSGARIRVLDLQVAGAQIVDASGDPVLRGLADGSADAVVAARASDQPLVAAVAAGVAGEPQAAELAALSEADLAFLLRLDPEAWTAPVRAAVPAFAPLFARAWEVPLHDEEPWAQPALRLAPVMALAPNDEAARRMLVFRAALLLREGAVIEAERLLATLRTWPDMDEAWWLTARLRLASGDQVGAAEALTGWIARSPSPEYAADRVADDPALRALLPDLAVAPRFPVDHG